MYLYVCIYIYLFIILSFLPRDRYRVLLLGCAFLFYSFSLCREMELVETRVSNRANHLINVHTRFLGDREFCVTSLYSRVIFFFLRFLFYKWLSTRLSCLYFLIIKQLTDIERNICFDVGFFFFFFKSWATILMFLGCFTIKKNFFSSLYKLFDSICNSLFALLLKHRHKWTRITNESIYCTDSSRVFVSTRYKYFN